MSLDSVDPLVVMAKFDRRLDVLYRLFAAYPTPKALDASPYRDANAILAALRSAPLRELTAEALGYYAGTAITTVGSKPDFKHFLPRILYFAKMDAPHLGFEPWMIASKMILADWATWPLPERDALAATFHAAWAHERLQDPAERSRCWEWLAAMATLAMPLRPCFDLWTGRSTGWSMLQLAHGAAQIKELQRGKGRWGDVPAVVRDELLLWLASDTLEAALIRSIELVPPSERWLVDAMHDGIDLLQRSIRRP